MHQLLVSKRHLSIRTRVAVHPHHAHIGVGVNKCRHLLLQFHGERTCLVLLLAQIAKLCGDRGEHTVTQDLHRQVCRARLVAHGNGHGGVALEMAHEATIAVFGQLCFGVKANKRGVKSHGGLILVGQLSHHSSALVGNGHALRAVLAVGIGIAVGVGLAEIGGGCACCRAVLVVAVGVVDASCLHAAYLLSKDAHCSVHNVGLEQILVALLCRKLGDRPACLCHLHAVGAYSHVLLRGSEHYIGTRRVMAQALLHTLHRGHKLFNLLALAYVYRRFMSLSVCYRQCAVFGKRGVHFVRCCCALFCIRRCRLC